MALEATSLAKPKVPYETSLHSQLCLGAWKKTLSSLPDRNSSIFCCGGLRQASGLGYRWVSNTGPLTTTSDQHTNTLPTLRERLTSIAFTSYPLALCEPSTPADQPIRSNPQEIQPTQVVSDRQSFLRSRSQCHTPQSTMLDTDVHEIPCIDDYSTARSHTNVTCRNSCAQCRTPQSTTLVQSSRAGCLLANSTSRKLTEQFQSTPLTSVY